MFNPKQSTAAHLLMDAVMPFGDHLEELRKRMIWAMLGVLPILIVTIIFARPLVELVIDPVEQALLKADLGAQLIQTSPLEVFLTAIKLAVIVTILAGSPWILLQAWLFVAPGLYDNERRFVYILIPMSAALTASAIVFLYKILMPIVLTFFIGFGTSVGTDPPKTVPVPEGMVFPSIPSLEGDPADPEIGMLYFNLDLRQLRLVVPDGDDGEIITLGTVMTKTTGILQQYRVAEYTKMFLNLALAFALGFQTPVVILLLGWVGIIEPRDLLRYRKHVMLGCMVISAVLTPADPLSMMLLALPLYVLFEFGVVLHSWLPAERVSRGFKKPKKEPADAGDE